MAQGFARRNSILNSLQLLDTIYYTSSGTFEKADYPGLKYIKVSLVGGGGSTPNPSNPGSTGASASDGGGGGGYAEGIIAASDLGASETVTVGSGGQNGATPTDATASSFGSHVAASAGATGLESAQAGSGVTFRGDGRPGGIGTLGDKLLPGGVGEGRDIRVDSSTTGNRRGHGGKGGDSVFGVGGAGVNSSTTSTAGNDGRGYGAGGSGAARSAGSDAVSGGNGTDGIVIVEVYGTKVVLPAEATLEDFIVRGYNQSQNNKAIEATYTQVLTIVLDIPVHWNTYDVEADCSGDIVDTSGGSTGGSVIISKVIHDGGDFDSAGIVHEHSASNDHDTHVFMTNAYALGLTGTGSQSFEWQMIHNSGANSFVIDQRVFRVRAYRTS